MNNNEYPVTDKERVKLEKFKEASTKHDAACEKLSELVSAYEREQMLLEAKYLEILTPLKVQTMRNYCELDKNMSEFWRMFTSHYEGEFSPDMLYIDLDDFIVKIDEDYYDEEDKEREEPKNTKRFGERSKQDERLKKLFGEDNGNSLKD